MITDNQEKNTINILGINISALNKKQILEYISSNQEEITITKLVDKLTVELHCSHSTLWNNIRQLKRMEILQSHAKGSPIEITLIGKYISQKMKCGGDNDTNNRK